MVFDWLVGRLPKRDLGRRGEAIAAKFLRKAGYRIVARGQRSRIGEIDLVAVEGRGAEAVIVFVEVKTRRGDQAGRPDEAVTPEKQRRLAQAALAFLRFHGLLERRTRFDVIAVTWADDQRRPVIEHYRHAFEAAGGGQMFQ
jgi:putative endonuclease